MDLGLSWIYRDGLCSPRHGDVAEGAGGVESLVGAVFEFDVELEGSVWGFGEVDRCACVQHVLGDGLAIMRVFRSDDAELDGATDHADASGVDRCAPELYAAEAFGG